MEHGLSVILKLKVNGLFNFNFTIMDRSSPPHSQRASSRVRYFEQCNTAAVLKYSHTPDQPQDVRPPPIFTHTIIEHTNRVSKRKKGTTFPLFSLSIFTLSCRYEKRICEVSTTVMAETPSQRHIIMRYPLASISVTQFGTAQKGAGNGDDMVDENVSGGPSSDPLLRDRATLLARAAASVLRDACMGGSFSSTFLNGSASNDDRN